MAAGADPATALTSYTLGFLLVVAGAAQAHCRCAIAAPEAEAGSAKPVIAKAIARRAETAATIAGYAATAQPKARCTDTIVAQAKAGRAETTSTQTGSQTIASAGDSAGTEAEARGAETTSTKARSETIASAGDSTATEAVACSDATIAYARRCQGRSEAAWRGHT